MKTFVKSLGFIILFSSVIILVYYSVNNMINNTLLGIAGSLLVVGLFTYIITNKMVEDN